MSTIDYLLNLIAPHECLACQKQGSLLCYACSERLKIAPERCYRCHRPSAQFKTCEHCYKRSYLRGVYIGVIYQAVAKQLIWQLKFGGAQAAIRPMTSRLATIIDQPFLVVPVPTASSRVRRRGYDQAMLLARALARHKRLPYAACLHRIGQAHQVGAGRRQRLQQLSGAFQVARPALVRGKHVLLVDDVITTGATFESAARVLRLAGAASVSAIAFAGVE
jgi:ComF family protein